MFWGAGKELYPFWAKRAAMIEEKVGKCATPGWISRHVLRGLA